MALEYHRTSPGDLVGDVSRDVLEEFTKDNCSVSPCSKWRVYFPKKDPKQRDEEREAYEYFDGDGNLYDVTTLKGRSVASCFPRVLRFPLKVPSDAQDGCSAVALQGGANHVSFQMHYEWQRVPSTYSGRQGVWAVHVTIKRTCTLCTTPAISHAYYYPPKAVWVLRVEGDNVYDLASITP
ncbi:MAG: hypothetical protein JO036_14745 [Candidatus Eremiobacteraeota bacterium]|nr:hypothetical protein [Candidatus Eremiobacteraeota bacterium]